LIDYGEIVEVELCPGGQEMVLTKENRDEYVRLYVDYLLNTSIHEQFSAFKFVSNPFTWDVFTMIPTWGFLICSFLIFILIHIFQSWF
jgi:hypothetical protein